MERKSSALNMFNESVVEHDEVSPSITLNRSRRLRNGPSDSFELVYTEEVWAAINNTLAGCAEFNAWQQAQQWILVTDHAYQGDAAALLKGCEALAKADASVLMIDSARLPNTLLNLKQDTRAVLVLAVSASSVEECASQADNWHVANGFSGANASQVHLLWLPHDRTAQSEPVSHSLEELAWASLTIVCDLAKLSSDKDLINESIVTMLRAAVYIDAQFLHWIEGNLTALADGDDQLHRKAIMRAANAIFAVKRRRSEEPSLPMAFTDTAALRCTHVKNGMAPNWQVKACQLLLDIRYSIAANELDTSAADRILRVMDSLNLISAAQDVNAVVTSEPMDAFVDKPFLILKDFGNAQITREFITTAWLEAISPAD